MDEAVRFDRAVHPIGVVSARTGLSADVIRVWERRYGVVEPVRDDAGRRLYSDGDIERLHLLAQATAAGRSISRVSSLGASELRDLVQSDAEATWASAPAAGSGSAPGVETDAVVERSLDRARALDGAGLTEELKRAATVMGLSQFLEGVVAPLLRRVGEEWHAGRLSVAQEHLASEVASSVVGGIATELSARSSAPVVVVGTPSGEHHQIGALLVAAVAGAEGWRVAYLGSNVPAEDIVGAAKLSGARCVALSVVGLDRAAARSEVETVRAGLPPAVGLVVGGSGAAAVAAGSGVAGVEWLEDLGSLTAYLGRS